MRDSKSGRSRKKCNFLIYKFRYIPVLLKYIFSYQSRDIEGYKLYNFLTITPQFPLQNIRLGSLESVDSVSVLF